MEVASFFDRQIDVNNASTSSECFRFFDRQNKNYLDQEDFLRLTAALLEAKEEEIVSQSKDFFAVFDRNRDQKIDEAEFESVWNDWIKPLVRPVTAFIVVDVQNDFISGSLALKNCPAKQEGSEVVPIINDLIANVGFDVVAYSLDDHPQDHISFIDNVHLYKLSEDIVEKDNISVFDTVTFEGPPKMVQKLWPRHCVHGSWGAKLHEDLKLVDDAVLIYKGMNARIDSYSVFFDNMRASKTKLDEELKAKKVTHVFVCGLALDVCVAFTALDALDLNYATVLVQNASRGTDIETIAAMVEKFRSRSGLIATSNEVQNLVKGKDIRLEFARVLAARVKQSNAS